MNPSIQGRPGSRPHANLQIACFWCTSIVAACNVSGGAEAGLALEDSVSLPAVIALPPTDESVEASWTQQSPAAEAALAAAAVGGSVGTQISQQMDEQAAKLTSALEGLTIERLHEGIKVTLDVGITFDQGSHELSPETMDYLTRLAGHLMEFPGADLLIVAHTDRTGFPEENLRLSERRALAALEYLAADGIERSRMSHLGRGEGEPIVLDDQDPSDKRVNRRMEIAIFASDRMKATVEPATGGVP
jgi:outer membrane protein OmpA-like peptidoglycan-associated protein